LAVAELSALSGARLSADDRQKTKLTIASRVTAKVLARQLSFYEFVTNRKRQIATSQVLREA